MVPRFTLQGEYRIELWKFNEKLCWEGDICCSVIVEKGKDQVDLVEICNGGPGPQVGETVQLARLDLSEHAGKWKLVELPERNEYTVLDVQGSNIILDRPYIGDDPPVSPGIPPSKIMMRRVPENANIIFVQREVLPRLVTINSNWRPCEFTHEQSRNFVDATNQAATELTGRLEFFPDRDKVTKTSLYYANTYIYAHACTHAACVCAQPLLVHSCR